MADPRDLVRAFQDAAQQLRDAAASATRSSGLADLLNGPLRLQAELLENLARRQSDLEGRVTMTRRQVNAIVQLARDAPAVMRTQAQAFEAASVAFKQAADLMALQAQVLEAAGAALKAPEKLLKSGGDRPAE